MNITIIGRSGFVGTRITKRLLEADYSLRIVDKQKSLNPLDLLDSQSEIDNSTKDGMIGKFLMGAGLLWFGLLIFSLLMTYYFTTVMLDMTFPYLVMSKLLIARAVIFGLMVLSILQIIFGHRFQKIPDSKIKTSIFWVLWLWTVLLVPIGTSTAISLNKLTKINRNNA